MPIRELEENEMKQVSGGSAESQIISAIIKGIETIYNLGYEFGSGIRRLIEKNYCPLN